MNKLGTELANAWIKKTLVDLNGFSENEIPKNRDEAYKALDLFYDCLLYTSPSPRDRQKSRMPSSA